MATVPHVTSCLGLRKFQADGFLLTRVYINYGEKTLFSRSHVPSFWKWRPTKGRAPPFEQHRSSYITQHWNFGKRRQKRNRNTKNVRQHALRNLIIVFILQTGKVAGNPRTNYKKSWYHILLLPHPALLQRWVASNWTRPHTLVTECQRWSVSLRFGDGHKNFSLSLSLSLSVAICRPQKCQTALYVIVQRYGCVSNRQTTQQAHTHVQLIVTAHRDVVYPH